MALDDRTTQGKLTPEERRGLLRAFADRMLLKVTAMDDPEDMPCVERAVRVAAVIERIYSRCNHAERQILDKLRDKMPDPRKVEAERATHEETAIKARVSLVNALKCAAEIWGHGGTSLRTPQRPWLRRPFRHRCPFKHQSFRNNPPCRNTRPPRKP